MEKPFDKRIEVRISWNVRTFMNEPVSRDLVEHLSVVFTYSGQTGPGTKHLTGTLSAKKSDEQKRTRV